MTDTEILDWMERERPNCFPTMASTPEGLRWCCAVYTGFHYAPTLREAVEKAAREDGDG